MASSVKGKKENMTTPNEHWNAIFSNKADHELGWYEKDVSQTLKFVDQIPQNGPTTVFLPGAGTSILVDELLTMGHELILSDISDKALDKLKTRIGTDKKLTWLHGDISKPLPGDIPPADIWIDRAVLHFLLDETEIQRYFRNVQSVIKPGGHVLLAQFSTAGAQKCAGLEVHRYDIEEMTRRMGSHFKLVTHEHYTYITPVGDPRPYIYALFEKNNG